MSLRLIASILVAIFAFLLGYGSAPKAARAPEAPEMSSKSPTPASGAAAGEMAPAGALTIPVTIVSIREKSPDRPTVIVEYPQFPTASAELNAAIASSTLARLAQFRKDAADNAAARRATETSAAAEVSPSDYSFSASWDAAQIDPSYISLIVRYDSYVGGANDIQELETFAYDATHRRMMALADLFPGDPGYLKRISDESRSQLTDSLSAASDGNAPADMIYAGTEPTADDFRYFTFTDSLITFYFPKYAVAPGSFGEQKAVISRTAF